MDFETRSAEELKPNGGYKYSLHPTTRPTCLAFKEHGIDKVYILKFDQINTPFKKLPRKFQEMWLRWIEEGYEFSAHNAFFETCIYKNILVKRYGWPDIPFRQFRCTAAKAASCALPRNLAGAGEAMELFVQKDKLGYSAMMKTCKPTKAYKQWQKAVQDFDSGKRMTKRRVAQALKEEPPMFLEYAEDPLTWETLYSYCIIDVRAEEALDDALPDLIPFEQEVWFHNQKLNWEGVQVDIPLVKTITEILKIESDKKLEQLDDLTMGLVTKPGATKSILRFLEIEGVELPNLRAKTVDDALKSGDLSEDMQTLLTLRKELSKTSTKKYESFLRRSTSDNKVRDLLLYHGASTGRDTGTGIQIHNFPRPLIEQKEIEFVISMLKEKDVDIPHTVSWIENLYGSIGVVFSSMLRSMIQAASGKELFVADFSKIEVAVLWWLAGNEDGLEILRAGKDPYIYQAARNLNMTYEEVEEAYKNEEAWANDARQLGKAQILGCGFGMGWRKFRTTAWDMYRLLLTKPESKDAVKSYREANEKVPELWSNYELAAVEAIETGKKVTVNKCVFFIKDKFLWIRLPSGRHLAYRKPEINFRVREYEVDQINPETGEEETVTKYSEPQKTIEFMAPNSKTKKWNLERSWGGTLTENIVQAVARDLMVNAFINLSKAGYKGLFQVHDEIITEILRGAGRLSDFIKIMCTKPTWADDALPLDAKGWIGDRYRK